MKLQSPLFIVDGSSFLYRAYYGMRPLQTSQGLSVQAIYSFCRMLRKLIKDFKIEYILIVWDSKGKNIRHEIFPEYKANRDAAPIDLFSQKDLIVEFLNLIGMAQLAQIGIEADDLIASVAHKYNAQGYPIVIVSGDKDLAQIVTNDSIKIFDAFKEKMFDQRALTEKYGFSLDKLPFYFSMLGDASDNIPGVKGIGAKGATDLVQKFTSLDDLYEHITQIDRRKIRELLLDQKAQAYLSLKLFTLQQYPIDISVDVLRFDPMGWLKAIEFLTRLEFKSLVQDIEKQLGVVATDSSLHQGQTNLFDQSANQSSVVEPIRLDKKYNFILITNQHDLELVCNQIRQVGMCAVDTETQGLDPMVDSCVGISLACTIGTAYYIPFGHITDQQQLSLQLVQEFLGPIFADKNIAKVLHHAKFDQIILHQIGIPLVGVIFDTLIAASLLVQDWQKKGLKNLSEFYFQETMTSFDELIKLHSVKHFGEIRLTSAACYAAADAHQTLQLFHLLEKKLQEDQLDLLFYRIEMPINQILVAMQLEGIYCDPVVLGNLDRLVTVDIARIEKDIAVYAPYSINLNSPKQIKELLFDQLRLPGQKKNSKSHQFSTDAQVLAALSKLHPAPALILTYRELYKLKSTYLESLPEHINRTTGKIHSSFNQTMVATGRLSSSNPNLQNIPTGSMGYPIDVRSAFYAPEGYVLIAADYAQIELKVLAHLSQDEHLIEAFRAGKDIHAQTAAHLFHASPEQISSEQRNVGKTINFSVLYGLTSFGLSKNLEISYKDAQKYIAAYFAQYAGVVSWMDQVIEFAKKHGYIQTLHGRKRYVPGIYEQNKNLYELAKRVAINSVVQGTAAEIMKIGMINLQQQIDDARIDAKILLQIHDELILQVKESDLLIAQKIITTTLESVVDWQVRLTISFKIGKSWHDITK